MSRCNLGHKLEHAMGTSKSNQAIIIEILHQAIVDYIYIVLKWVFFSQEWERANFKLPYISTGGNLVDLRKLKQIHVQYMYD